MDECKRKVSSDIDDTCHKRKKSKLHKTERSPRSRSSASSSPTYKKKKRNKSSKKSHRRSQPSSTSSSYDSSDGGHHSMQRKKKKKRKKKKDHKKESKLTKSKQEIVKEESSSEDIIGPNPSFMSNDNMKPLTKEEWEKQQSVVRKVYDEETGRNRLIRGDGEILEEIVSYKKHSDINKAATIADGFEFKKRTGLNKKL